MVTNLNTISSLTDTYQCPI